MKLGIYVGNIEPEQIGGGFTFQDAILRCLENFRNPGLEIIVIYVADKNIKLPGCGRAINLAATATSAKSKTVAWISVKNHLAKCLYPAYGKYLKIKKGLALLQGPEPGALQKAIEDEKIDLVYFATPVLEHVQVPFIYTVWDLGHRVMPMFPEVQHQGLTWEKREQMYSFMLPRASYIITGNAAGAMEISTSYGILPERIKTIPFFTPEFALNAPPDGNDTGAPEPELAPYIFYPAQFWAHKNHLRVLLALNILRSVKYNRNLRLVFTGSDQGNLSYIKTMVSQLALEDWVTIKGFVPREELIRLYRHAEAMVYVSYLGPNNLPPLEAMALGCPVIASDIAGHRQQLGDAAWYADPDRAEDVAAKIEALLSAPQTRTNLIAKGHQLARDLTPQRYGQNIMAVIKELMLKRECWSHSAC